MAMNVWPVPDALASAYKGSGYALAAIKSGAIADLIYIADILPYFDPENAGAYLSDHRLVHTIAHLSALGDVSMGICSCWEFCEL